MAHPYKEYAHKNDPNWLRGVEKFTEKARSADLDDTIRNHGGSKKVTQEAAYEPLNRKGSK